MTVFSITNGKKIPFNSFYYHYKDDVNKHCKFYNEKRIIRISFFFYAHDIQIDSIFKSDTYRHIDVTCIELGPE